MQIEEGNKGKGVAVSGKAEENGIVKRRVFLKLAGATVAQLGMARSSRAEVRESRLRAASELRLAGMNLAELLQKLHDQLFDAVLPFWDKYGVDHEYGGLICSLDYDGTPVDQPKNLWFLGRAIWIYSFLYNHFGRNFRHLDVARKTRNRAHLRAPARTIAGRKSLAGRENAAAL